MSDTSIFEILDGINDELAAVAADFEPATLDGRGAQRVVCACADIERFAIVLKTLAMRRVDATGTWRDGARSAGKWLANATGTSLADAHGTVELGEQLESLPDTADAARRGALSPLQAKLIGDAASKDPASEQFLLGTAKQGTLAQLKDECTKARQRAAGPDAAARIHARRSFRDWTDKEGAYCFAGTLAPFAAAKFKSALEGFTNAVFEDARAAGIRDSHEQYRADALVRMAEAALANAAGTTHVETELVDATPTNPASGPTGDATEQSPAASTSPAGRYTKSRVNVILVMDAAAWNRGEVRPGERCEIVGIGPVDINTARRLASDAIIDIVLTHGVDVRTLAHAGRTVTRAQLIALLARGYECAVRGCGGTTNLEIDHVPGYALTKRTSVEGLEFKCGHCHDLKTYKRYTDGPRGPDGKRTLIPPRKANSPPDEQAA